MIMIIIVSIAIGVWVKGIIGGILGLFIGFGLCLLSMLLSAGKH